MKLNISPNLPGYEDGNILRMDAEPFPQLVSLPPEFTRLLNSPVVPVQEPSSEPTKAPLSRKHRPPKELPRDNSTELRNSDLARWESNYLTNMAQDIEARRRHKASATAKQNAAFFVHGSGLGNISTQHGGNSALSMFAGRVLVEVLSGTRSPLPKRRTGEDYDDSEIDIKGRRVRSRYSDGEQLGRIDDLALNKEDISDPLIGEQVIHAISFCFSTFEQF